MADDANTEEQFVNKYYSQIREILINASKEARAQLTDNEYITLWPNSNLHNEVHQHYLGDNFLFYLQGGFGYDGKHVKFVNLEKFIDNELTLPSTFLFELTCKVGKININQIAEKNEIDSAELETAIKIAKSEFFKKEYYVKGVKA
jgi:hypothetical protein